jgi:hypothetical protein
VLLCSGFAPELLAEQTWHSQVSFLSKPFSLKQLSDLVLEATSLRPPRA